LKPRSRRGLVAFVLLWAPYALLVYRFWWLCDDAFISFRYARNWASGAGLRFNPGEHPPVEGYSNFLWTAFCALIEVLGLDVTSCAPVVSFACGSLLLYLVFNTLRRSETDLLPACLATLSLGCFPPFFVWSTGGLETMPLALLMFLTFERLVLRRGGPEPVGAGIAGLGMALIRVDGIAWSLLFGVLALFKDLRQPDARSARQLWRYFAIVGVGFAVYVAWRFAYYERPLSNSAYAKMGLPPIAMLRGVHYVLAYFLTFLTPVVFLGGCVIALRRATRAIGIPVIIATLASLAYAVATGADFMTMWRFLVPGFVVFNTLLLAWLLQVCWGPSVPRRSLVVAIGGAIVGLGLLPAWNVHLVPESVRKSVHFRSTWPFRSERDMWERMSTNSRVWSKFGLALKEHTDPGDSCVLSFIGAIGYYTDLYIYDRFGLVTPEVASRKASGPLYAPGHDKGVPHTYFLKDHPTILYVANRPQSLDGVAAYARRFEGWRGVDRYVTDFIEIHVDRDDPELRYLVILRRIDENADPDEARANLWRRIRALERATSRDDTGA